MSPTGTHSEDPQADLPGDPARLETLLDASGTRVPNPLLEPLVEPLDLDWLRGLYRDMVILRRIDAEGVSLQRQGELGLWAPCRGQEAAQIGSIRALERDDFAFTSYRELGVVYGRGGAPADFVRVWRGEEGSGHDPYELRVAPMQIIIGAQSLHAVGYAFGIRADGGSQVAVSYFGDGATSEGDVSEALLFAASYGVPAVFVCQNNHWAISEPVTLQTRQPIAARAAAFGMPSLRVDGNDVLACFAATKWAADHARAGNGPVFIEAVTYRMGPHTTADDPRRYRSQEELERWEQRDPIDRVASHLRALGGLSDEQEREVESEAASWAAEVRAACLGMRTRAPLTIFDHVYAEPHPELERQRNEFAEYLAGFEQEGSLEA